MTYQIYSKLITTLSLVIKKRYGMIPCSKIQKKLFMVKLIFKKAKVLLRHLAKMLKIIFQIVKKMIRLTVLKET